MKITLSPVSSALLYKVKVPVFYITLMDNELSHVNIKRQPAYIKVLPLSSIMDNNGRKWNL